jgi:hypothetical protein
MVEASNGDVDFGCSFDCLLYMLLLSQLWVKDYT